MSSAPKAYIQLMSTPTAVTALAIAADIIELQNCRDLNLGEASGSKLEKMKRKGELDDKLRQMANQNRGKRPKIAKAKAKKKNAEAVGSHTQSMPLPVGRPGPLTFIKSYY